MIELLRQWSTWLCPVLAIISGVCCSFAYLKSKYKQRFTYLKPKPVSLFIVLISFAGLFIYLLLRENAPVSGVMKEYALALASGAIPLLSGLVGIRKPGKTEKEFIDVITLLLRPIEESIDAQVNKRELALANECHELRNIPIDDVCHAIELIVQSRFDKKDERLKEYSLDIERHRSNKNFPGLIAILLKLYPPDAIKKEFVAFCLKESQNKLEVSDSKTEDEQASSQ